MSLWLMYREWKENNDDKKKKEEDEEGEEDEELNFDDFENYYKNHKFTKFLSYKMGLNDLKELYDSDFDFKKTNSFCKKFYSNKYNKVIFCLSLFLCVFLRIIFLFSFCGFCYLFLFLLDTYTNLNTSYIIYFFLFLNFIFIIFFYFYWPYFRLFSKSTKKEKEKVKPLICRSLIDKFTWNVHFWNLMKFYIKFEKINELKNEPNSLNEKQTEYMSDYQEGYKIFLPYFLEYTNIINISIASKKISIKDEKKFKKISDKKFNYFKLKNNKSCVSLVNVIQMFFMNGMIFIRGLLGSFFIPVFLSLFTALIYFYA